jgi:polyribonucleotide nucleotidyltransferase
MKPESKKYSATVGNQTLMFETGKLAAQARWATPPHVGLLAQG